MTKLSGTGQGCQNVLHCRQNFPELDRVAKNVVHCRQNFLELDRVAKNVVHCKTTVLNLKPRVIFSFYVRMLHLSNIFLQCTLPLAIFRYFCPLKRSCPFEGQTMVHTVHCVLYCTEGTLFLTVAVTFWSSVNNRLHQHL